MNTLASENLQQAIRLAGIHPKKGLGQNFLVDEVSLNLVATAIKLSRQDCVLEIGPGLGFLTTRLTAVAGRVIAVEADVQLAEILGNEAPLNLEVTGGDIMNFNLPSLPTGYKVVANIPYYLTSKLLRRLLESPNPPAAMALLVQKEVAERITAAPGQLSILALSVQYYAQPSIQAIIERHKFWPAPKVDSAVLVIIRRAQPAFPADPAKLFRLIKAGFGERRKQLKNSLAGGLNASTEIIELVLHEAKITVTKRAQELTLKDWQRLYTVAVEHDLI